MRYIGNKTKLLPFITRTVRRLGLEPGSVHDGFAGTAAVGRAFKMAGWRVASSDLMTYSHVFQRAYVVASRTPAARTLCETDAGIRSALRSPAFRARCALRPRGSLGIVAEYLSSYLDPEHGFLSSHFAPAGGRMFFTNENAARIDAARRALHEWNGEGLLSADAYYALLAALIEAADRVANTTGVYAAYIKQWQPNALRSVTLMPEIPLRGRGSTAHCGDAAEVARRLGAVDLLYIDPPYNGRQYAGYYHVPEIIARGWLPDPPAVKGKTGLLATGGPRSAWCARRRVGDAFRELLESSGASSVLVSYNSEGLLSSRQITAVLCEAAADGRVRRFTHRYRRYRADRERAGRRYSSDTVTELLYHARLR